MSMIGVIDATDTTEARGTEGKDRRG